jgi:ABC-type amino acid transport substrate-binding protein
MYPPVPRNYWLGRLCALLATGRRLRWTIILLIVQGTGAFAGTLDVVRPMPEAPGDARYDHYWQLLARALTVTEPDFGPFALREATLRMSERRALEELESGSGAITVLVYGNVADYEQRLLPIRFPLDKGLLGYRVFLIRGDMQSKFDGIKSLEDLRRHSIGLGRGWGGVTVLRDAGLNVVEGTSYEGLFSMLAAGRFDLFSRGVVEVGDELVRERPRHPEITIERGMMLFYPVTRYFYVTRSPAGDALARRISEGLERMLKDGSFERMFEDFKSPLEDQIGLRNRRVIRIANPLQTSETPLDRTELWYDPQGAR